MKRRRAPEGNIPGRAEKTRGQRRKSRCHEVCRREDSGAADHGPEGPYRESSDGRSSRNAVGNERRRRSAATSGAARVFEKRGKSRDAVQEKRGTRFESRPGRPYRGRRRPEGLTSDGSPSGNAEHGFEYQPGRAVSRERAPRRRNVRSRGDIRENVSESRPGRPSPRIVPRPAK